MHGNHGLGTVLFSSVLFAHDVCVPASVGSPGFCSMVMVRPFAGGYSGLRVKTVTRDVNLEFLDSDGFLGCFWAQLVEGSKRRTLEAYSISE